MKQSVRPSWVVLSFVSMIFLSATYTDTSLAQRNPCAAKPGKRTQNPCAPANPCAAKNPCAVNPCAPGARGGTATAKAVTVRGEVAKIDTGTRKLVLKREGGRLELSMSQHSVIREGAKVKKLTNLKPGENVFVSYVDGGKDRTAWYVYVVPGTAMANPCGGNPCAAANPCAVQGKPSAKNPCATNPCAAKNPCATKGARGR